jgi:hypothetical protein
LKSARLVFAAFVLLTGSDHLPLVVRLAVRGE